jgi:hypothetical protein
MEIKWGGEDYGIRICHRRQFYIFIFFVTGVVRALSAFFSFGTRVIFFSTVSQIPRWDRVFLSCSEGGPFQFICGNEQKYILHQFQTGSLSKAT